MKRIIALVLAASVLAPGVVAAESGVERVSYGAASAVGTVIYTPLKGLLCGIGGGFGGAAAFLSSGVRAMRTVANASCKGTWVITPEILKGEKPLEVVREPPCCGYFSSP